MAKKGRLGVPKEKRGGSGMKEHLRVFLDANCYIWNGWAMGSYCTAQGNVCDWVTLLYNRTWWNIVNQLHFNNNDKGNILYVFLSIGGKFPQRVWRRPYYPLSPPPVPNSDPFLGAQEPASRLCPQSVFSKSSVPGIREFCLPFFSTSPQWSHSGGGRAWQCPHCTAAGGCWDLTEAPRQPATHRPSWSPAGRPCMVTQASLWPLRRLIPPPGQL